MEGDPIVQAQRAAFRLGLEPDQFWRLTPWELGQWLKAQYELRQDDAVAEARQALAAGWYAEYYSRFSRRLPNLTRELESIRSRKGSPGKGGGELSLEASAEALRAWKTPHPNPLPRGEGEEEKQREGGKTPHPFGRAQDRPNPLPRGEGEEEKQREGGKPPHPFGKAQDRPNPLPKEREKRRSRERGSSDKREE